MSASGDPSNLEPQRERGGPVGRPVIVLVVLIGGLVAAGYVIYALIKGANF